MTNPEEILITNEKFQDYLKYHRRRIARTLEKLHEMEAKNIVEIGSHPWIMTAALIDDPSFKLCATVSAEESTYWPDDIGVHRQKFQIRTPSGKQVEIVNYSANVERTLFDIQEKPDTILACEIVEHLIRAPHIMFLNINHWLPVGGRLFLTTPNGAQFSNPFRRKSPTPAYRSNVYERHSYVYTLDEIRELVALCGFKITEAGYEEAYDRTGLSRIYGILSRIPLKYFQDKFKKMIYLAAEKEKNVTELEQCPKVYDSRGEWEFIRRQ